MSEPVPAEIKLRTASRVLEVSFDDGQLFQLPFEHLRVHSPPPEGRGQGRKEGGESRGVEPVGQDPVKLVFDDGHDTGLYTWKYLYELGRDREANWSKYLARKAAQG